MVDIAQGEMVSTNLIEIDFVSDLMTQMLSVGRDRLHIGLSVNYGSSKGRIMTLLI